VYRLRRGQTLYQILANWNKRLLIYSDLNIENLGPTTMHHGFQVKWISIIARPLQTRDVHTKFQRNRAIQNWGMSI